MMSRLFHFLKKFPIKLLVLFVAFILTLYLFGFIVHEVLLEKEEVVDLAIAKFISNHIVNDNLTKIMKVITFFGSLNFLLVANALLFLWYFLYKKSKALSLDIAAIAISGTLITYLLKELFQRVRPADPLIEPLSNYSFPSGHASSGFIFYGLLAWLIWKLEIERMYKYVFAGLLILFSLLIGFSRIYLRIHYASDVLAGFCIGFAWLAFSLWILNKLKMKNSSTQKLKIVK